MLYDEFLAVGELLDSDLQILGSFTLLEDRTLSTLSADLSELSSLSKLLSSSSSISLQSTAAEQGSEEEVEHLLAQTMAPLTRAQARAQSAQP